MERMIALGENIFFYFSVRIADRRRFVKLYAIDGDLIILCSFNTLTTDEEKCTYLQNECAPDGYINYLQIYYCKMPNIKWVAWIIFVRT
jgi:hypothetical protein